MRRRWRVSWLCTASLATGATVTICMPSSDPLIAAPSTKALGPAAIMWSAGARSLALTTEYAAAAVAPAAIAAATKRARIAPSPALRCSPRRPDMSMTSVLVMPSSTSVWLSRYA